MPKPKDAPPLDYTALAAQLVAQMAGPVEVETPQLGRVQFPRPAELYLALSYLKMAQAQAAGVQTTGVFTVGYCRGLGPSNGGCC